MNPPAQANTNARFRKRYVVLLLMLFVAGLAIVGVTGFFRLGSETTVLRKSLTNGLGGQWNKKIAVHVGGFTTALVRLGMSFVKIPPEARAALNAVHAAEVGVYKLQEEPTAVDSGAIFRAADEAMAARGWDRVVGVAKERELVAVYLPRKRFSSENMRCCVMVLHERDLVVASARGNLEPLLQVAERHFDLHGRIQDFARR